MPPPTIDHDLERRLRQYLEREEKEQAAIPRDEFGHPRTRATMLQEILNEQQRVKDEVLGAFHDHEQKDDARHFELKEDIKGIQVRVTQVEGEHKSFRMRLNDIVTRVPSDRPPRAPSEHPAALKAKVASRYEQSPSGVWRLTDFELHDLAQEAETYKSIKRFLGKVAIPVSAVLIIGLLTWIGLNIWHPPKVLPVPASTGYHAP